MAAEQTIGIPVSSGPAVPLKSESARICAVEAIKATLVPHSSPCHLRAHADAA